MPRAIAGVLVVLALLTLFSGATVALYCAWPEDPSTELQEYDVHQLDRSLAAVMSGVCVTKNEVAERAEEPRVVLRGRSMEVSAANFALKVIRVRTGRVWRLTDSAEIAMSDAASLRLILRSYRERSDALSRKRAHEIVALDKAGKTRTVLKGSELDRRAIREGLPRWTRDYEGHKNIIVVPNMTPELRQIDVTANQLVDSTVVAVFGILYRSGVLR